MSSTSASFASSTAAKVALAVAVAFGAAANANAAETPTLEIGQLDLSRPLRAAVCVADTLGGVTAPEKLATIMVSRSQGSIITANKAHVMDGKGSSKSEDIFTVQMDADRNIVQGGEGYRIASNMPKGQSGTKYCLIPYEQVVVLPYGSEVPTGVNKGVLGQALTNASNSGRKVSIVAMTPQGSLDILNYNYATGVSGLVAGPTDGSAFVPKAAYVDTSYSKNLSIATRRSLRVPEGAQVALAPQ